MKSLKEIIENYKEYEMIHDDRFGKRLCDFLTKEQGLQIGFESTTDKWPEPKEWTRENILAQLAMDVEFGSEKAFWERGISSSLMFEVVRRWNIILEDGLEDWPRDYYDYGMSLFRATAEKYGFKLYYGWYEIEGEDEV